MWLSILWKERRRINKQGLSFFFTNMSTCATNYSRKRILYMHLFSPIQQFWDGEHTRKPSRRSLSFFPRIRRRSYSVAACFWSSCSIFRHLSGSPGTLGRHCRTTTVGSLLRGSSIPDSAFLSRSNLFDESTVLVELRWSSCLTCKAVTRDEIPSLNPLSILLGLEDHLFKHFISNGFPVRIITETEVRVLTKTFSGCFNYESKGLICSAWPWF